MDVKLIISVTNTGSSTMLLAKYRPKANILAVTSSTLTARQLSGVSRYARITMLMHAIHAFTDNLFVLFRNRGVTAMLVGSMSDVDTLTLKAIAFAKKRGLIESGDIVILVHGLDAVSKSTNVVKVIEVDKQGYSSPKHSFFSGIHIPFT